MKAIKYQIMVHESVLSKSHNFGKTITEVFIPDFKICFNNEGYVFDYPESRAGVNESKDNSVDINIPDEMGLKLKRFVEKQNVIKKGIKEFFLE